MVSDHGANIREASNIWRAKYIGYCDVLGIKEADVSAANLVQMMYNARRASEGAAYRHYLIAGRALSVAEMPEASITNTYARAGAGLAGGARQRAGSSSNVSAVLKDGFDVRAWFDDWGPHIDIEFLCEMMGWGINNPNAGEGINIMCPNHPEHSEPDDGSDTGCWGCSGDGEKGFVVTCHHAHCSELYTWDFIRLMEEGIENGDGVLPDEFENLSQLLCDPMLYPDEVDGNAVEINPSDYGATISVEVIYLSTPMKVEKAFNAIVDNPNVGDDHFAALYAGIGLAGNKAGAVKKLEILIKEDGRYKGNDLTRLKKLGSNLVKDKHASAAREREQESRNRAELAFENGNANPSMDIADPLGETLEDALATLYLRWRPVSIGGKFVAVRVPDLSKGRSGDATIETMSKFDFISFHADRSIPSKDGSVNPAKEFFEHAPRCSGMAFSPPPVESHPNEFNLYFGRHLVAKEGDCSNLKAFIRHTVCRGRDDVFKFVWLWMAHLVQSPGVKPGTAIVLRGEGGCGKSTFGLILEKLCAPYSVTLAEKEHVVGRFAGQHLSTSLIAICTEAVFAGDPEIGGKLKNLITSTTMSVEGKGLPVTQQSSYLRLFFDSNDQRVVPIEGNGSERRYFVAEIGADHKDDKAYFDPIYSELNGEGIAALKSELQNYDPADDGMVWEDLRTAPETPERREMRWHSMSPMERNLLEMFEDREVIIKNKSGRFSKYAFEEGVLIRISQSELREYFRLVANKYKANEGDIGKVMESLFGNSILDADGREYMTVNKSRGKVDCLSCSYGSTDDEWGPLTRQGVRYFEFPPIDVLLKALRDRYGR